MHFHNYLIPRNYVFYEGRDSFTLLISIAQHIHEHILGVDKSELLQGNTQIWVNEQQVMWIGADPESNFHNLFVSTMHLPLSYIKSFTYFY